MGVAAAGIFCGGNLGKNSTVTSFCIRKVHVGRGLLQAAFWVAGAERVIREGNFVRLKKYLWL